MAHLFDSIQLDKNVPIPLYYQLKKQILTLINESKLKDGMMVPPENDLCRMFNVSRPTIRQAFSELAAEGHLTRHKGRGTFISRAKVDEHFFSKLESFNDEMTAKGLTPKTQVLVLEKLPGPQEANEKLEIPLDAALIHLCRLRMADNIPLVIVDTYLPFDSYPELMKVNYKLNSLYTSLEKNYNKRVSRVIRQIEAINVSAKDAAFLKIAKNKALSLVKTIAYSDDSPLPVEYSVARYRGDMNKFTVELYR
jgi:GntR family transcriptional regulator